MNLLFITRKVDRADGLAGFTFNWLKHFAQQLDKLYVLCLEKGDSSGLLDNIQVFSLGKEQGKNRWREFWILQSLALKLVPRVDGVFSHQNPEYGILIAPYARIFSKKLIAWYAHGKVSWKLRLLTSLADKIITSTDQGLRLPTKKKVVLHQGTDTELFAFQAERHNQQLELLSISRLGASKNIDLMIDLVNILKSKAVGVKLTVIGEPATAKDEGYYQALKNKINQLALDDQIVFLGSVANEKTPQYYQKADCFLNFSDTGSLDKTILEAMSCGALVISSNSAAAAVLPPLLTFTKGDLAAAADKILAISQMSEPARQDLRRNLRQVVVERHSLRQLVTDILKEF